MNVTLGTDKIGNLVTNWHVSDEIFSDHRCIVLWVGDMEVTRVTYCNAKRTNWESYREYLKANLGVVPRVVHSVRDVELAVDMVQQDILSSCHQNSPAREALPPRTVTWWNKELSHLEASPRWLFNQAKIKGDWESYKMALTCYNKEISKGQTVRMEGLLSGEQGCTWQRQTHEDHGQSVGQ